MEVRWLRRADYAGELTKSERELVRRISRLMDQVAHRDVLNP